MRDHTKLRAFELADEVALLTYKHTAGFPKTEQFGLTSQMRRAAVSVPSNIVEGCARDSSADYVRFSRHCIRFTSRVGLPVVACNPAWICFIRNGTAREGSRNFESTRRFDSVTPKT